MFMRAENLMQSLDGICASCSTQQPIRFKEVWDSRTLYLQGWCPNCDYEHWVPVQRA